MLLVVPPVSTDVTAVPNATSPASLSERATPASPQATPKFVVVDACDHIGWNVTVARFQLFGKNTSNWANCWVAVSKSKVLNMFLLVDISTVPDDGPLVMRGVIAPAGIQMVSLPCPRAVRLASAAAAVLAPVPPSASATSVPPGL